MDEPESGERAAPNSEVAYHQARQTSAQAYNQDMSKWILGSLIVINGAPFVALKDMKADLDLVKNGSSYLIAGLICAVLCGFFAWLNTGMREASSGLEVRRIFGEDVSQAVPNAKTAELLVTLSYSASLLAGFGSLIAFGVGAFLISKAVR